MRPTSLSLTDDMSATALRISTEDGAKRPSVADGMQWAIEAVKLLTKEQRAWLTRRDDAPAALEDAVRQAMAKQERAEAEADATVDGYSTGRW
jgi:uncharacterized protein YecT (DUF1311 family)